MDKKKKIRFLLTAGLLLLLILAGIFLLPRPAHSETIGEAMNDAVLHESNKISLFGWKEVNPSLISGFTVTAVLLLLALLLRLFVIPRFTYVPGKLQLLMEEWVGFFDRLAKGSSPHQNGFLGAYIFAAGSYIFVGTIFELLGLQAGTTEGHTVSLPAPLADINGAICMGCLSYLIILSGGIMGNGLGGVGKTLKEFSLPVSMSFRIFGALLSGMLVTELVYYYLTLSFVLPVIVGILFTLMHALIQAYVLTMLTAMFYGEVSEKPHKKEKKKFKQAEVNA